MVVFDVSALAATRAAYDAVAEVYAGLFRDSVAGVPFDHKAAPAYRLPVGLVADLVSGAGLVEVARSRREPGEGERFRQGRLLARRPLFGPLLGLRVGRGIRTCPVCWFGVSSVSASPSRR